MCFRFVLIGGALSTQGWSSVLKQRDFYDPRFITWIESRFDTYVFLIYLFLSFLLLFCFSVVYKVKFSGTVNV